MNCNRSPPASPWPGALLVWCSSKYGLLRKITQFRYQAYVALVALSTGSSRQSHVASPANFGVRDVHRPPLVLISLCLRAIAPEGRKHRPRPPPAPSTLSSLIWARPPSWHFSVSSLRSNGVTSWAAVVFALLGAALLLVARSSASGIVSASGSSPVAWRIIFSAPANFSGGDWQGRYFVLSSAAAILLASMFFAFRLR